MEEKKLRIGNNIEYLIKGFCRFTEEKKAKYHSETINEKTKQRLMEAKNFRIGNYIEYLIKDELDDRKEWWEVSTIDAYDLKWLSDNDDADFREIELTEEWLLKFGFNNDYKDGYIGIDICNSDFVLTKPFKMGEWQDCFCFQFETGNVHKFREIKYVHQLQNLYFALTGEELTIK